jgi:hypothetical protein
LKRWCHDAHIGNALAKVLRWVLLLQGLRKHVGFEYDVDADTVEDVTCEMLQNLSLRQDQVTGKGGGGVRFRRNQD